MTRALLIALSLCASLATAQTNTWDINLAAGDPAMEEISPLTFRVTNLAKSTTPIEAFSIGIPPGPYDIDGATAPVGWRTTEVDRRNRRVTFRATTACTASSAALRPGQSALFEVRVIGVSTTPDQPGQDLQRSRTEVLDVCSRNVSFKNYGGVRGWTLHGLTGRVFTNLRALDLNDQLTVSLTVTNTSSAAQNAVAPLAPTVSGTASFVLVSGPTPSAVNSLAHEAAATFTWVYRATARGTARFTARASNGAVSSPQVASADVNVGLFPAAVVAAPTSAVSGGQVTLQVLPTNNSLTSLTYVQPLAPVITATGTATATLTAGPTPAQVDALSSRSTTSFTSTWRVQGQPGERLTFQASARATDASGSLITTAPVSSGDVVVREFTVSTTPTAVIANSTAQDVTYSVANGSPQAITSITLLTPDANLFRTPSALPAPAGWTASVSTVVPRGLRFDASAAARLQPGQSVSLTVRYATIGAPLSATPTSHKAHLVLADGTTARAEGTVTVAVARPIPDVMMPVVVTTPGRAHFSWSNPTLHDGVLVLRSQGAPPNTSPLPGRRYPPGTAMGNATVVYEDSMSFNTSFADPVLTNGVSYYYRVFNRDEYGIYSPGNAPSVAPNNALLVIPPGGGPSDPMWCSTTGLPSLQQPFTDLGKAVYQSTNGAYFTANTITTGLPVNGNEKWRPSPTRGVVQARPTAMRVGGAADVSIFVGDQLGYAYRVDGATGAITWVGNGGVALGEVIQAQSVLARRDVSGAAFQGAYPTDVIFFATRNSTNRTSNSVRGLRVDTGAQVYAYQPGDLDQVIGTPLYDSIRGQLWVGSLRTAGASLRVLDLVNKTAPPLLVVADLGDLATGVVLNSVTNQALVADRNGTVRGYSMTTKAQAWQLSVGSAVNAPLVPFGSSFFVSTATGVQRYHIDTATMTVTPMWAAPAAMRLPTAVRVDPAQNKLYVGDGDGFLRKLDFATGAIEASVRVSTIGGVSMPSFDTTAGLRRVYVGTADGRLCAYPPF